LLCKYAFDVIIAKISKKAEPKFPSDCDDGEYPLFVTWLINEDEELWGCIGTFRADKLSKLLGEFAKTSAFKDDRFDPISLSEVEHLTCGVSLLTDFEKAENPLDWEVGTHGIEIDFKAKGKHYSGTFLPEVAEEYSWSKEETL